MIEVRRVAGDDPLDFEVVVREGEGETRHLGTAFAVQPITVGGAAASRAAGGRFIVTPGVYVLSAAGPVDVATLPQSVGAVGFAE